MKKVLDKALEKKVKGLIDGADDSADAASQVIETFRELQDASGLKVCQKVTKTDVAYRGVK